MTVPAEEKTLYLLRHPETEWNVEGRFQGRLDSRVTKKGRAETLEFVEALKLEHVDVIYFAENERTRFLADAIARRFPDVEMRQDQRLNERDGGIHEGRLYIDIYGQDELASDYTRRFIHKPPRGESYEMLAKRVSELLLNVKKELLSGKVIIFVTSSGVIRSILRLEKKLSVKEMFELKIPNLSLIETRW